MPIICYNVWSNEDDASLIMVTHIMYTWYKYAEGLINPTVTD